MYKTVQDLFWTKFGLSLSFFYHPLSKENKMFLLSQTMAVGSQVLLAGCVVLGLLPWCQKNKKVWSFNQLAYATKISLRCRLTVDEEESIAQHSRGNVSSAHYNSVKREKKPRLGHLTDIFFHMHQAFSLWILVFFSSTNTSHSFPTRSTKPGTHYWCSLCHCCSKISCKLNLSVTIRRKFKTFNEMTKLYSYHSWKQEWKVLSISKEALGYS